VPLLEAMWHRVPVVALASSAVPETLGSAGVLLPEGSDNSLVAASVHRVLDDASLRDVLVAAGLARVEEFSLARTRTRFADTMADLLAGSG